MTKIQYRQTTKKPKVVRIEFVFPAEEWAKYRKRFTDSEIRSILRDDAIHGLETCFDDEEGEP